MKNILTQAQIGVECPYPIQYITELKITGRYNEHSRVTVAGILLEEDKDLCIDTAAANDPITVYEFDESGAETCLFSGVVISL